MEENNDGIMSMLKNLDLNAISQISNLLGTFSKDKTETSQEEATKKKAESSPLLIDSLTRTDNYFN